jgi:hypothetical protein
MTKRHYPTLVELLQMAFGPDRNLDGKIAVATTASVKTSDDMTYARERDPRGGDATHPGHYFMVSHSGASAKTAPCFTASVDEALRLLPEGCDWLIGRGQTRPDEPPYGVQVFPAHSGRMVEMPVPLAEGEHPSLAIAICIAALEARAAIAKASGQGGAA